MSGNHPSSNNSDLNMIAISTVAAQLALDIRGPASQEDINRIFARRRYLGARERPSAVDQGFLRIWNDSQTKKDYDAFDPAVTTEASEGLKTVYRACLRVFRTSPHEILSPLNKLRYRPTPRPGMEASHAVYTTKFSRLFAELTVPPCWEGNPNLLVMAIQYTAKMHLQARDALTEAAPSEFSDFLIFLGQIARMYPSSDYSQTYLGLEALSVTTKDLQILAQAVKRFHWDNIDWTDTPKAIFEEFERKGGLSDEQWPRNNRELKRFMRRALMCSYQTVAVWRDVFETSIAPEETPSDNEVLPGDESGFETD
ncbi:hypothetical protein FPANT_2879 [Fusarium pseudoanthophilum]|uniref:Uncharacterized protein n=1 Tax=Fusarium pseudoanthophilum TaxID=48495 RepID=A0A8H5PPN6_9HYPO|nr:hypothetical protein FPANT_2879 [Fusarium pseudoanthophilum]